jgi:hypothetical protein
MQKFPSLYDVARTLPKPRPGVLGTYNAVLIISDYNWILKQLTSINKELPKQLKRDYREAAKPVQQEIQRAIRSNPLGRRGRMSGFRQVAVPGRLAWGVGKPPASALIRVPRPNSRGKSLAIAQVSVGSPATVLADMAGKSNKITGGDRLTRDYRYSKSRTGTRRHKITTLGSYKFISNLNIKFGTAGEASRVIYPAADIARPNARKEIAESTDRAVQLINQHLGKAN